MANSANISIQETGTVGGTSVSQTTNTFYSTVPTGSLIVGEAIYVTTAAYQQIFTGSGVANFSRVTIYNTNITGSLLISGSATAPLWANISPGQAASIPVNGLLPSVMAQGVQNGITASLFVIPQ
jgi:hypothetical protein